MRLPSAYRIWVVDPSQEALDVAKTRAADAGSGAGSHDIRFVQELGMLPEHLALVIVATTADVRLRVLAALFGRCDVRYLILEKVLFQRRSDYEAAFDLLASSGTQAWVNCPRRAWRFYSDLKEFLSDEKVMHLDVTGGNWGLGCNSVHFLDVLGFITDSVPATIETTDLDRQLLASKRPTFLEFTGSLRGTYDNGTRFSLTSDRGGSSQLLLLVRAETKSCLIDETRGLAFYLDPGRDPNWSQHTFSAPLMSELIGGVVEQLLVTGTCALTPFEQSATYHIPMIDGLARHAEKHAGSPAGVCPIT